MGISLQLAGLYAYRAMANYFKTTSGLQTNWISEKGSSIWKWDMKWRLDLQYKNNGVNAMWELKPISHFVVSSLSGKSQVKFYADMETYLRKEKFYIGSSHGAPVPPINGRIETDFQTGYRFSYTVPLGVDGMIYYQCLNCDELRKSLAQETQPQTVNQTGTALAIALAVLSIVVRLIPN